MADVKISALPTATTPLAGTEVLPIVQSATTKQVAVSDLTTGRAMSASSLTLTTPLSVANGGTGLTSLTAGYIPYGNGTGAFGSDSALFWDNTNKRLGVGTTSPAAKLDVASEIRVTSGSNIGRLLTDGSDFYFGTRSNIPIRFETNSTTVMTLDTSGNLGIGGTPAANQRLLVSGGRCAFYANSEPYSLYFQYNSTTNGVYIGSPSANALSFSSSGGAEYARITSAGDLLVGTTSVGVGKTTIYSATNSQAAIDGRITVSGDVGTRALYLSKYDNNNTTSQILVQFAINNGAAGQGQINANGANTAAFGSYSDHRLKKNIVDLPSQLDSILSLRPREFDYIESEGGGHQIGFIAQEMETVYPDAVGERPDGMLTITAWSKTEARLVSAIQELAAKVSALEARI